MAYLVVVFGVVLSLALLLTGAGGLPLALTALVMMVAGFVSARLWRNRRPMRQ